MHDATLGESVLFYPAIFAGFKHTKSCILPAIHFHLNVGLMLGVSMNLQLSICIGLTMPSDKLYFVQILFCFGNYFALRKTLDYATDMQLIVSMQIINKPFVLALFMLFLICRWL